MTHNVNNLSGFGGGGGGPAITGFQWVDGTSSTSGTSLTMSNLNLGTATDRVVVVVVSTNNATSYTSVTFNGQGLTAVTGTPWGTSDRKGGIYIGTPTGAQADLVFTWSGSSNSNGISVYKCYGANTTPYDIDSDNGHTTGSISLDVAAGGLIIAGDVDNNDPGATSWDQGGLNNDYDLDTGTQTFSTASLADMSVQTGYTVGVDSSSGGVQYGISLQPAT